MESTEDVFGSIATESRATRRLHARVELIVDATQELLAQMDELGMSKAELARRLGRSRSFVTQVLDGKRNMTLGTLSDIAFELDCRAAVHVRPRADGEKVQILFVGMWPGDGDISAPPAAGSQPVVERTGVVQL